MRIILFSFIFLFIYNSGFSQHKYATQSKKAIKHYEEAISAFNTGDYKLVEKKLNAAIKKDSEFIDAYLLRAELFRVNYMFNKQITDLQKVVAFNPNYFPYAQYNLGIAQWNVGNYQHSKKNLEEFLQQKNIKESSKNKAIVFINKCNFAQSLIKNPVDFKPISLGKAINTKNDQYWPSLSIDGNTLIYSVLLLDTTRKTIYGDYAHQEDFYISNKVNGQWTKGIPLGRPINTAGNEGALKISADGNTIVFTACNRVDGLGRCDIYFAYKTQTGWSKPSNAGKPINTNRSEKQPCLSADGNTLYFSSNRPDGIGGMDIWYSEIDERGLWSEPINMGTTINTKYDEESPFFHPDNQTFYFSSDGHLGLGMKDIFYSRISDSLEWEKPENIGYPINTYRDEIGLFIDNKGTTAYFSSNYNDSSRNIYRFAVPEKARPLPVSYLTGMVTDIDSHKPLKAKIQLINVATEIVSMNVLSNKLNGNFTVCLPSRNKYALNISCKGYLFKSMHINLTKAHSYENPLHKNIELQKVQADKSIVLQNIFFELDSYELLPDSHAELIKIREFIANNSDWVFEIGGFTDNTGTSEYNLQLSVKRAKAVYDYLIAEKTDQKRLTYKGYGETKPISLNSSPKDKALNRRTELRILSKIKK